MNNQEVRKYLRKGELAVSVLESLGYQWKEPNAYTKGEWVAPDVKEDSLEKAIKELVLKETSKAVESLNHQRMAYTGQGPNWDLVKGLVGKKFSLHNGFKIYTCTSVYWNSSIGAYKVTGVRQPPGLRPSEGITHNLKGLVWRD